MIARVAMLAVLMGAFVLAGLVAIPIGIQLWAPGTRPDVLCGRACLPPGVTENPEITLIGD